MSTQPYVNLASPGNQPLLAFFKINDPEKAVVRSPSEVNHYALGTHPDLVEHFWKLGNEVQKGCACVIGNSGPLLSHPTSGIIFGLAGGTSTMAFRLPEPERGKMLAVPGYGASLQYPNTIIHASDMGPDWVLVNSFDKRNPELCQKAFAYAGTL